MGDSLHLDLVLGDVSVYSVDRQVGWCLALQPGWNMIVFEISLCIGAHKISGGWMWGRRWWIQCLTSTYWGSWMVP